MGKLAAVFSKEIRIAFATPVAYAVFGGFTLICSFLFVRILAAFQSQVLQAGQMHPGMLELLNFTDRVLSPLFSSAAVLLVFAIPFLTMRSIAEERRNRTLDWLLANPIGAWHLVLGKFLAILVLLVALLAVVCLYPLLVSAYVEVGEVAWETVGTGLLGLLLLGGSFAAVGMFVSAMSGSQIVAAFVCMTLLLLLWLAGAAAQDNLGLTRQVLLAIGATEHMRSFATGLLDLKDVVYYLSLTGLGLFLTHRRLLYQRWQ